MLRMSLSEPERGLARSSGCCEDGEEDDGGDREGAAPVLAESGGEVDADGSTRFEA